MLFWQKKSQLFFLSILLLAAFFVVEIKKVEAAFDPAITYSKTSNGQLSADEWNNLQNDFMRTWASTTAVGGIGIGIAPQGTDLNGLVASSTIKTNTSFLGALNASYITPGAFNSVAGTGGNFSFPAALGVGVTPVNAGLHLSGSDTYSAMFRLVNSSASGGQYFMGVTNSAWDAGGNKLVFGAGTPSSANIKMVMAANGNVGIGTTNPVAKLDVLGTLYQHGGGGIITTKLDSSWINATQSLTISSGASASVLLNPLGGNIGIGTLAPDAKLDILNGSLVNTTSGYSAHYRNVLTSYINDGGYTGTMKIVLPKASDTMVDITIKGYNYSNIGAWEVRVSGYLYSGTGGGWYTYNHKAQIFGSAPFNKVRLAWDGSKPIILLGDTSTNWSYGTVVVSDFIASFRNVNGWGSGWSASVISSEAGITTIATPTIYTYITPSGNVGIGTTTPQYKLDVAGEGNFNDNYIHGVRGPVLGTDAANRSYVDTLMASTSAGIITQIATSSLWQGSLTGAIYNNNSGNVGIGTTNPTLGKLMINANADSSWLYLQNASESGFYTRIYNDGTGAGSTVPFTRIAMGHTGFGDNASINFYRGGGTSGGFLTFTTNTDKERMIITASGNVGIGTTTPNAALDVFGNAKITNAGLIYNTDSSRWLDMTGTNIDSLRVPGDLYSTAGVLKADGAGNSYVMGKLGVGTSNPGYKLDVSGIISGNGYFINSAANGNVHLGNSSNGEYLNISNNGNVGIGTTTPGEKLHVLGNIKIENPAGVFVNIGNNPGYGGITFDTTGSSNQLFNFLSDFRVLGGKTLRTTGSNTANYININVPSTDTYGQIYTAGISNLALQPTGGNVGIGTTAPNFKFVVNGDASFSGYQIHNVGAPATGTDVANRNYVDSVIAPAATTTVGLQSGFWTTGAGSSIYNNNTGNVGIGTTAPGNRLTISNGVTNVFTKIDANSIKFTRASDGADRGLINFDGVSVLTLDSNAANGVIRFLTDGRVAMTVFNNQNVGIGTTTPNAALDIFGKTKITNNGIIYNTDSSRWLDMTGANADSLRVSGNLITTDGNVGIGTTAPNQQLEITKNFRLPATSGTTPYGIIYKDGNRFIHDFNYGLNGNGITTDGGNTFVGLNAGNFTMGSTATQAYEASYNTGIGYQSLYLNTTGYQNTANGFYSLYSNTTGYQNTANGYRSLYSNTTGYNNTANGYLSLYSNTTGSNNTALGLFSGRYLANGTTGRSTGNYGLYLGYNSKASADGTNNEIVIGANAIGKGSNTASYGNSSMTKHIFEAGNVGIGTTTPSAKLTVAGGNIFITDAVITSSTPHAAITKTYLDSALETLSSDLSASTTASNYWLANGTNIYNKNTGNVGIGTTNPADKVFIVKNSTGIAEGGFGFSIKQTETGTTTQLSFATLSSYSAIQSFQSNASFSNRPLVLQPSGGNVGIGTTTPAYLLDVNGLSSFRRSLRMYNDGTFSGSLGSSYWLTTPGGATDVSLTAINNIYLAPGNTTTPSMIVKNGGSVGIGTTSPQVTLDVNGLIKMRSSNITTTSDVINKGYLDSALEAYGSSNNFWKLNGSNLYSSSTSWNVGIGTTSPTSKLTISSSAVDAIRLKRTSAGLGTGMLFVNGDDESSYYYLDGNQNFQIGMGSSWDDPKITIQSTGNVGIGTISPTAKTEIVGSASNPSLTHNSTSILNLNRGESGATELAFTIMGSSPFTASIQHRHSLSDGSSYPIALNPLGGNVGIGTTAPQVTLDVNGLIKMRSSNITTTSDVINKGYLDSALEAYGSSNNFWKLNGSNLYSSSTAWNVGIGTTNPYRTLSVNGFMTSGNITEGVTIGSSGGIASVLGLDINGSGWNDLYLGAASSPTGVSILTTGNVGIGTTAPNEQLEITKNFRLPATSGTNPYGIIYKNGNRFIHDFNYGLNGNGITTNGGNTFIGLNAGNLTMGSTATQAYYASYNTGIGYASLNSNTTGESNTANGFYSLSSNTTGYQNTANGVYSLRSNTTGNANTANGVQSLYSNTTGSNNTAIGYMSGRYIANGTTGRSTGNNGLYLGYNSKASADGTNNEIVIGANAIGKGSNTASYGNSSMTKHIFEAGNVGIGTTTPSAKLTVAGGNIFITDAVITSSTPHAAITKTYLDSALETLSSDLSASTTASNYWLANGTNIYNKNTGNVGIGTTAPGSKLHIFSGTDSDIGNGLRIFGSNSDGVRLTQWSNDVERYSAIYSWDENDGGAGSFGDLRLGYSIGTPNGVTILGNSGNVGIGTTSPGAKLDVNGSSIFRANIDLNVGLDVPGTRFTGSVVNYGDRAPVRWVRGKIGDSVVWEVVRGGRLEFSSGSNYSTTTSSIIGFNTGIAPYFTIGSTVNISSGGNSYFNGGNVGIGTTTPGYKLHVAGEGSFLNGASPSQVHGVAIPTQGTDAASKNYINDTMLAYPYWYLGSRDTRSVDDLPSAYSAINGIKFDFKTNGVNGLNDGGSYNGVMTWRKYGASVSDFSGGPSLQLAYTDNGNLWTRLSTSASAWGTWKQMLNSDTGVVLQPSTPGAQQTGNINISGTITAGTISATGLTGTVNASNVTPGAFNSTLGTGGNYSFPASVGIGVTTPVSRLHVSTLGAGDDALGQRWSYNGGDSSYYLDLKQTVTSGVVRWNFSQLNNGTAYNDVLVFDRGNVGIGTTDPGAFKLKVAGNVAITGTLQTMTGSDFAEEFVVSSPLEAGTVVVMGDLGYKSVKACGEKFDSTVVGVVSDNPSIIAGRVDSKHKVVVAMAGVVKVKVSDVNGKIKKGTMLTTSNISGYAMKADSAHPGTIIGKALENLSGQQGEIKVLINLQ